MAAFSNCGGAGRALREPKSKPCASPAEPPIAKHIAAARLGSPRLQVRTRLPPAIASDWPGCVCMLYLADTTATANGVNDTSAPLST